MAGQSIRLRQVALVAADLEGSVSSLCEVMSVEKCFRDPGVGQFGLDNALMAIGDTFLEVVSPFREGTTAGRYLQRRAGDGGYMAIFQMADLAAARQRVDDAGLRTVWSHDSPTMSGTHLHPGDVPGAIVSLDHSEPEADWEWAGPGWRDHVRTEAVDLICGLDVQTDRPDDLAAIWAQVLGVSRQGDEISLNDDQVIRFVAPDDGRPEGIRGFDVRATDRSLAGSEVETVGVRIRFV
ncbi:MAG: hypothetical protein GY925_13115 [Actinomycetia bacterium]|nr:hypothetical protein [Actinomycetes bacterium]